MHIRDARCVTRLDLAVAPTPQRYQDGAFTRVVLGPCRKSFAADVSSTAGAGPGAFARPHADAVRGPP
jgi:hypothetical protein